MKIKRQEIVNALSLVNPGLASKAIIEQSECFIFQDGRVYTFNDEMAISHAIDLDIEGAVNGKKLLDLLKKCADDELDIFTENGLLRVHGKKARAGIKMDMDIKLPFSDAGDNSSVKWATLPEDFSDAVHFCLFSVGRDASRPLLTCVHVHDGVAESCDNFRVTRRKMKDDTDTYLIPADAAKELIGYKPIEAAKVGGWLHFRNAEGTLFCCRTYSEEYPDIEPLLKVKGEEAKWPEAVAEALERAEVFGESTLKGNGTRVMVTLSDGRMTVRGEGDHGFFEEDMRVRYSGEACFEINAAFFAEILQHTNIATIGNGKLKFEDDNWTHVVCLLGKSAAKEKEKPKPRQPAPEGIDPEDDIPY